MINRFGLQRPSRFVPILAVVVVALALVPADGPGGDGADAGAVAATAASAAADAAVPVQPAIKIATVSQKPASEPEPMRRSVASVPTLDASATAARPASDDLAAPAGAEPDDGSLDGTTEEVADETTEAVPEEPEASPNYRIARVGASALNVRAGPSSSNQKLFVLRAGEPVRVAELDGNWARIVRGDGDEGWVFARYLNGLNGDAVAAAPSEDAGSEATREARTEAPAARPEAEEAPAADGGSSRYARIASDVPARAAPSPGAAQLFVLPAGERVKISEIRGPWVHVVTNSGVSGWVRFR